MPSSDGRIRVLIVDDSVLMCRMFASIIGADPQLMVVGMAHNGEHAVELARSLHPDIITLDVFLGGMDGLEATKQIMAFNPTPILLITSTLSGGGKNLVFQALACGALDVIEKKMSQLTEVTGAAPAELTQRIKQLACVKVITHPLGKKESRRCVKRLSVAQQADGDIRVVGIAASTGGPQALATLLKELPKSFSFGVVIVQHIADGFAKELANWLNASCEVTVMLASSGATIQPGVVYLAPTGMHMRVARGGAIQLVDEPAVNGHKPSANVLMASLAENYGNHAIGVILTGMGSDGVSGLKQLKAAGGKVFAQDEATSAIFGMPKMAIEAGIVDEVLPIDRIAGRLIRELNHE